MPCGFLARPEPCSVRMEGASQGLPYVRCRALAFDLQHFSLEQEMALPSLPWDFSIAPPQTRTSFLTTPELRSPFFCQEKRVNHTWSFSGVSRSFCDEAGA